MPASRRLASRSLAPAHWGGRHVRRLAHGSTRLRVAGRRTRQAAEVAPRGRGADEHVRRAAEVARHRGAVEPTNMSAALPRSSVTADRYRRHDTMVPSLRPVVLYASGSPRPVTRSARRPVRSRQGHPQLVAAASAKAPPRASCAPRSGDPAPALTAATPCGRAAAGCLLRRPGDARTRYLVEHAHGGGDDVGEQDRVRCPRRCARSPGSRLHESPCSTSSRGRTRPCAPPSPTTRPKARTRPPRSAGT